MAMGRNLSDIRKDALALSAKDRAELADRLLESLDDETEEEVEDAWRKEIRRRAAEVDSGAVKTIPWSEVKTLLIADLKEPEEDQ